MSNGLLAGDTECAASTRTIRFRPARQSERSEMRPRETVGIRKRSSWGIFADQHARVTEDLARTCWMYADAIFRLTPLFHFVRASERLSRGSAHAGCRRRQSTVTQLGETLFPWTWTAPGLALLSGFFMFTTDGGITIRPVFRVKMTVILIAMNFRGHRPAKLPQWVKRP